MEAGYLREHIVALLEGQGFEVQRNRIVPPPLTKDRVRRLHDLSVQHRVVRARNGLRRHETRLLGWLAAGHDVIPDRVMPQLVEVRPRSEEELLFRYASLHWSIPVSSGYGRRLRFLVLDRANSKLIGLIGLGDPVFNLAARDQWIGWTREAREQRLWHVMDAFVLGAVPPYSYLLCGKLVAMLAASTEVVGAFSSKYGGRQSIIRGRAMNGQLALLTTASALGRSSLYNRITYGGRLLYQSTGFTRGSGEFHFANGLYSAINRFAAQNSTATAKHERWGTGFRNRREVIKKCLSSLGLPTEWLYHGVKREFYVVPLAHNTREYLRGDESVLRPFEHPAEDVFRWFRERWLLPRAGRDQRYLDFSPESYVLWQERG